MAKTKGRTITFPQEVFELFNSDKVEFAEIFGREAQGDDPPLLLQILYSEEQLHRDLAVTLHENKILNDSEVYAFGKLGVMITKANKHTARKKDITEWNKAIKEYEAIQRGEIKIGNPELHESIEQIQFANIKLIYLYSLLIWKDGSNKEGINLSDKINIKDYVLFCLTRNVKSLKAAETLSINGFGEDALVVLRSMYENYLQLAFANSKPEKFLLELQFKAGLSQGTHKREKDKILCIKTGELVKSLNNKEKSSLNTEFQNEDSQLYYIIYENFSFYTHPDIRSAHSYVNNRGFSHGQENLREFVVLFSVVINTMILFELWKLNIFDAQSQDDIKRFINSQGQILQKHFKIIQLDKSKNILCIKQRVDKTLKLLNHKQKTR